MKLVYCRKQAQRVVEYINTFNVDLSVPINLRQLCEMVKPMFVSAEDPVWNGIFFKFDPVGNNVLCTFFVAADFPQSKEDMALVEIEVTEQEEKDMIENQLNFVSDNLGLSAVILETAEDVENFIEELENKDIERAADEATAKQLQKLDKGKLH